jgi:regulator of protease activity HflC (stomatin/prohibitin superfamily)
VSAFQFAPFAQGEPGGGFGIVLGIAIVVIMILSSMIKIVREYERGVVFRLGRLMPARGPGIILLIPYIEKMIKVDLRIVTMDVPRQEVMTRDNVPVSVDAVVYFRVVNPEDAVVKVENYVRATALIAQTTLRSIIGQSELDELLAHRDKINRELQMVIDQHSDPWGVKVVTVEVRDVVLPEGMRRSMARQAEVERERRAKIINAEGELQAAEKLRQAALIMSSQPAALQLRYLQTLSEVATENNSTIVFPLPIDLVQPFLRSAAPAAPEPPAPPPAPTTTEAAQPAETDKPQEPESAGAPSEEQQ